MALSNEQLLLLDILIYTNYVSDGRTVKQIVEQIEKDGYNISSCEMSRLEWQEIVSMIKEDKTLLEYRVTDYKNEKNGMRVACFVNDLNKPTDVNVIFRGTSGDYEWHDNGQGGYLSDTKQQELAATYINNLSEEYGNSITVSGHSKGGNKAQYVTIVTDRIGRCVSYDGQGFSQEFINKYYSKIEEKADRIISISASDDFVNCLMIPISGTRKYVKTQKQENFLHYHKPNILFDKNGRITADDEQSELSIFINEYTTYIISNVKEPERSIMVDGVIALLETGEDIEKESLLQTIYAGGKAITYFDDFTFLYIGEIYGLSTELLTTYILSLAFPYLFVDDLLKNAKDMGCMIIDEMICFAEDLYIKIKSLSPEISYFIESFKLGVNNFINNIKNWYNSNLNVGYQYATANPYIRLNTSSLYSYANRLISVNKRITNLDRRLDNLYWSAGLLDLWNLMQADLLTGYSWRLQRCINYLNETAADFDAVERKIASKI